MPEAVHTFFSQWDICRLCIEHNTLFHREVGEILRRKRHETRYIFDDAQRVMAWSRRAPTSTAYATF